MHIDYSESLEHNLTQIAIYLNTRMTDTLVMKFGGASVATAESFSHIADLIVARLKIFSRIAIVVSAMGDTTDQLASLAKKVNPSPPQREYDMLVSVGERISISLLAMALSAKNQQAISFTGSQSGIMTSCRHSDARIIDVRPHRLIPALAGGAVVIVAGFQGVSCKGEITTLGRGGSDTSAVALGIAIKAAKVEFYKDVPGICAEDPKKNPQAPLLKALSYDQALSIVQGGAEVLHPRSLLLAKKNCLPLQVKSFKDFPENEGTMISQPNCHLISIPVYEEE